MYHTLLILHMLGLALGVGTGFAQATLGMSAQKMPLEERKAFMMRAMVLGKNGSVGLLLLIVTGVGMMWMRGVSATMQAGGGAFHVKLTLVVLIIGTFGYLQMLIRQARREGGGPALAKLPVAGRVMLLLGIATVASAVLAFH